MTANLSKGIIMDAFSLRACALVALLVVLPAQAQVYKCKDATGKVIYQQKDCTGTGTMVDGPDNSAPVDRAAPPAQNPDARYLTSLIAAALAERDYRRAESLAVTAEHHAMINEAKRFNPDTCKFSAFVLGDEVGTTLAAAAKKECLSTRGQLGPAYVRWRDHYQTESARRSGIAATAAANNAANAANAAANAANRPNQGMTCRPDYLGGLRCN